MSKQKTAAQLLREAAERDPVGHGQRLARGYGVGPEMVQVPVSLIERMPHGQWCCTRSGVSPCNCHRAQFVALLSQPTPTAEPSPLWCADDTPHDAHRARNEFGGWNECTGRPAPEPPRVEDMAPGTTFTAEFHGDRDMFFRCRDSLARAGRYLVAMDAIDPSTIRDVRPPKDAA